MKNHFNSTSAPKPVGHYPHAKRVGDFLFLSGVGPRKRNSSTIPGVQLNRVGDVINYSIREQCVAVFENVKLVLKDSGAKWDDIVDVTVFLTNMKDDFPVFNQLYKEYFKGPFPTRTTVEVLSLPTPIAIELKVIAHLKNKPNNVS
jgi:2-aminomuconate deaminase